VRKTGPCSGGSAFAGVRGSAQTRFPGAVRSPPCPVVVALEAITALVDYFLKIDGIAGESIDAKHKGEIALESFSWGESQAQVASPGGGGGAGKVHIQDVHVTMKFSSASPPLMLACASGQHLKSAVLTARKAGKGQLEFLVYTFRDLLVSSYQTSGSAQEPSPVDSVLFSFAQIQIDYHEQRADGSAGTPVRAGWDVKANRKL
jgi:type VI secretion system secreted protein Hcp